MKTTRLRRYSWMRRRRPTARRSSRVVDLTYLEFVRSLPCAGCCVGWSADPHHAGKHGMGQIAGDDTVIPLCRRCHDAVHDGRGRYADQEVRRRFEELVQVGCQVLWSVWQRLRHSGYPLSENAVRCFSAAWPAAELDVNSARERAREGR